MPALRAQRALLDARPARADHRPAPRRRGPAPRDRADDPAGPHAARGADDVAEPRDRPEPQLRDADGVAAGAQGRRQAARRDGQRRDPRRRRRDAAASSAPGVDPVALVPVSRAARRARRAATASRRCSSTCPTHEPDPVARMRAVHEQMAKLKDSAAVRAGALLVGASGWAPPLVSSALARAMSGVRAFNLVVSNLPGPAAAVLPRGRAARARPPDRAAEPRVAGADGRRAQLRRRRVLRPARRPRPRAAAGPGRGGARRRARRAHA